MEIAFQKTMQNIKEIISGFYVSRRAEDRLFFARYVKTLSEIADDFLRKKELLELTDIEKIEKIKIELENILKEYKIYNL